MTELNIRFRYTDNILNTLRLNGCPTRTTFLTSRQPRSQIHFYTLHRRHIGKNQKSSKRGRGESCHETHSYIGRILPLPKDSLTLEEKSCLVYQVPCFDCDFVYIEQTKWDLKSRLAEHKLAIRNQEPEK